MQLTAIIEEAEEGGYVAYLAEMPNVLTQGETLQEVRENLLDALQLVLETQREIAEREVKEKRVIRESLASVVCEPLPAGVA